MSFLFGTSKSQPPNVPDFGGFSQEDVASNQSAIVLPWFSGTRWLTGTWIGDVFDVKTTPVSKKTGGSLFGKRTTIGYDYFSSFAALFCGGPVDRITGVKMDDQRVWTGLIDRNGTDSVDIAVENRGILTFYWGTETQTYNSLLSGSGQNHSAYRGQCYLVADQMYLGQDRTNIPQISVELGRVGRPDWFPVEYTINHDANPISVLWEWWTDARYGLGRSENDLDLDSLTAAATQLASEDLGVSPLLTTEDEMRNLLLRLFEYCDAYPTSTAGKLGVSLVRPPTGSIATIGYSSLTEDPDIETQQWTETSDEVRVKFVDYEQAGADNLAKVHDNANFLITGRHKALNVDREWATRYSVAWNIAAALARVSGLPQSRGRMRLRESSAASIGLGTVFDLQTRDGQLMRMRCTERTEPEPDRRFVDIAFASDTGWANSEVFVPTPGVILDTPVWTPLEPFESVVQDSPFALAYSETLASLLWLVARNDAYSTSYDVWKASASDGTYIAASERRGANPFESFAVRASLSTAYSADTLPIDDVTGISFAVTGPDVDLLAGEWDLSDGLNHELLAFVGVGATEIMSLYNVQMVTATTYTADVVRGLYDTERKSHAAGVPVWIQSRSKVDKDAWPPFSESARYYKFQTQFGAADLSLAHTEPVAHAENARSLLPLNPKNLRVNGDGHSPSWSVSGPVTLSWSLTSRARSVFGLPLGEAPPTDLSNVLLEFWTLNGDTLIYSLTNSPTTGVNLSGANLVSFGINESFKLKSYGLRNSLRSLNFDEVNVIKI